MLATLTKEELRIHPGLNNATPAKLTEAAVIMSVAVNQPHRRGSIDPKADSPLWRICSDLGLRHELYLAGEQYGEVSRAYKVTIEILGGTGRGNAGEISTEEQEEARADLAKKRYWHAINVLRRAHPMAQGVVERVCYDLRTPGAHDEAALRAGLYALAIDFGVLRLGINEGKEAAEIVDLADQTRKI